MTLYLQNAQYIDSQTLKISSTNLAVEEGATGGVTLMDAIPSAGER